MDRASGTRPVSISNSGFGHNALNFPGRTPRLRFDRMSPSATTTVHRSEASGEAVMPRWVVGAANEIGLWEFGFFFLSEDWFPTLLALLFRSATF